MNHKTIFTLALVLVAALGFGVLRATSQTEGIPPERIPQAANVGTAFTYQGHLNDDGSPANGSYDFQFSLYDDPDAGLQIGLTQTITNVMVTNGLFSSSVDFGESMFIDDARFLAIDVRPAGDGDYVALSQRQELTPVPYAISLREEGILRKEVVTGTDIKAANRLIAENGGIIQVEKSGGGQHYQFGYDIYGRPSLFLTSNDGFAVYDGSTRVFNLSDSGWLNTTALHSSQLYVNDSIGLGTESPAEKYHIYMPPGDQRASTAHFGTGSDGVSIFNGSNSGFASFIEGRSSNGRSGLYLVGQTRSSGDTTGTDVPLITLSGRRDGAAVQDRPILGITNYTDTLFHVEHDGKVGIGTTNPSQLLDVAGTANVNVLSIDGGADLAEPFVINDENAIEPGTVVILDPDNPGQMRVSDGAYDPLVAGIVSGAGGINPGLIMQQADLQVDGETHPVALTGQVYVKAVGKVEIGDLLTTSDVPGHAMSATDRDRAFGAVIGKAMSSQDGGTGLILVLVALQ